MMQKGLAIVAANYRELDELRITKNCLAGTNRVKILSKWPPRNINISPLKVLYVLNSYPQLSESYVEYEWEESRSLKKQDLTKLVEGLCDQSQVTLVSMMVEKKNLVENLQTEDLVQAEGIGRSRRLSVCGTVLCRRKPS